MTALPLVPVDQPARDLVSRDGLGRTLFVEAGAGTGKTTQLVERVANLVLDEGVPLAGVAAITFTEAAAAELQSRIRVRFEEELAALAEDDSRATRCRDAIAELDVASITTLHGFASRLLGEFAIDAGLPPRIRVIDEVAAQLNREDRWGRFVDRLHGDPTRAELLRRAAIVGVAVEPSFAGEVSMKQVAEVMADNWDLIEGLSSEGRPGLGPVDFSGFDASVADLCELPSLCTEPGDLFYRHLVETVIPEIAPLAAITDPDRKLRAIVAFPEKKPGPGAGGTGRAWAGDVTSAKARVRAVRDAMDQVVADTVAEVLANLLPLVAAEVLAAALDRQLAGGLEFHDLLVLSRRLLRTSASARGRLHTRFTHLLLDEFQDTDPIQLELAVLIAGSITDGAPGSWDTIDVEDGRLFFVGDPKQSIYRFRRAEIELFLRARDRFGSGGGLQRLSTNFRTVEPIINWVNEFFSARMPDEVPGMQPRYERLEAHRRVDGSVDHRPVLLGGVVDSAAGEARELEAEAVARVIADVRAHPGAWRVCDERTAEWRDARLTDVTILVPTRTSLPALSAALADRSIPYRLATGTLVYGTQEVRDVLAAVRAIDDATDELHLVAALRSPLFACSDVDLRTYVAARGRWDISREPGDEVPADHPVRLAMAELHALWLERWWLSPSDLLVRLIDGRGAFLLGFGDPGHAEVWRRLRFLVDQARMFEESGGTGLRRFVEWTELQSDDASRVHEPLLPETDQDEVSIVTIHGAKGLEFPITILSGMGAKDSSTRSELVLWGDDEVAVALKKSLRTANHEQLSGMEQEMAGHERLRLLYVAATRARDHLVVSCFRPEKHSSGSFAEVLEEFFGAPGNEHLSRRLELGDDTGAVVATAPAQRPVVDDRDEWISAREAVLAPQRAPRVMSATAVAHAADVAAGAADDFDELEADDHDVGTEAPGDEVTVTSHRRGRAGTAIGRATHATLQVLDLADPRDVEQQVRKQCDVESIPERFDTVLAFVRSALGSDAVRQAVANPHHKEIFVAAPVGDRVIEGYIDLLIETPAGLVVVDYKTDSASSPSEIDARLTYYSLQGASYAVALEEATGLDVVDCRFVFCKRSGAVERSVTDLPAAMQHVRDTLAR